MPLPSSGFRFTGSKAAKLREHSGNPARPTGKSDGMVGHPPFHFGLQTDAGRSVLALFGNLKRLLAFTIQAVPPIVSFRTVVNQGYSARPLSLPRLQPDHGPTCQVHAPLRVCVSLREARRTGLNSI